MRWVLTYKYSKLGVIGFVIGSLILCYISELLIKREVLSDISSSFCFDTHNNLQTRGIVASVVNEKTKEIKAFLLNPLVNWPLPTVLLVGFMIVGAGIIFHKSRLQLLERDKAQSKREIEAHQNTIASQKASLSEARTEAWNKTAEIDKLRKDLAKAEESAAAMSKATAAIKEQCTAALKQKDEKHAADITAQETAFAKTIFTMKKQWDGGGPPQAEANVL